MNSIFSQKLRSIVGLLSIITATLFLFVQQCQALPIGRSWRTWPFSSNSPWNYPIGSNAKYVTIANLTNYPSGLNYADRWTSSIVIASSSDPVVGLEFTPGSGSLSTWTFLNQGGLNCGNPISTTQFLVAAASPQLIFDGNYYSTTTANQIWTLPNQFSPSSSNFNSTFNLPSGACPSPDSDGLLSAFQPDGRVVDIYAAVVISNGTVLCTMASWIDAHGDGTGWWNGRRASMLPSFAGLIRTGELSAGLIPHALAIQAPGAMLKPQAVWPAYAFDRNYSNYSGSLPMGSLLAIPANVDITKLGLSPQGLIIAHAAQDYGVYIVDQGGGGITFLAQLGDPEIRWNGTATTIPWWADIEIIKNNLKLISNNAASNPGGGGKLRAPLAPPFID
ncbi:MAG: hypothetical protein WCG16_00775 [Methylococcales bacterium]